MKVTEQTLVIVEGTRHEFFDVFFQLRLGTQSIYYDKFKQFLCSEPFEAKISFTIDEFDFVKKDLQNNGISFTDFEGPMDEVVRAFGEARGLPVTEPTSRSPMMINIQQLKDESASDYELRVSKLRDTILHQLGKENERARKMDEPAPVSKPMIEPRGPSIIKTSPSSTPMVVIPREEGESDADYERRAFKIRDIQVNELARESARRGI